MMHPQTPGKTQMWVPKWKQQKNELGYVLSLLALWGKKRMMESGMGIKINDKWVNYAYRSTQTKQKVG